MKIIKACPLIFLLPFRVDCFSGSYLDNLSQPSEKIQAQNPSSYLDSLGNTSNNNSNSNEYTKQFEPPIFDLEVVSEETPSDHYAKDHPGAGWAGYHHPLFGGYLNNLKQNVWEDGKEADYGDDIRWGAQVYLDNM